MKKKILLFCVVLGVILLTGCGKKDQIKLDIYQYLNTDVKPIAAMHNDASAAYNAYMDKEDGNAEQLLSCLSDEVIPAMEQVAHSLGELSYDSREVNTYVTEYKTVVEQEIEALLAVVSAVQNHSEEELAEANAKIHETMQAMDNYQTGVRTFAASYGLTLVEKESGE